MGGGGVGGLVEVVGTPTVVWPEELIGCRCSLPQELSVSDVK